MNHGGGGGSHHHHHNPRSKAGPRTSVSLGLEAAQSTSNILRLLEASHGGFLSADALSTVWHPKGLLWKVSTETDNPGQWEASNPLKSDEVFPPKFIQAPSLVSLSLSDDRTALVKLIGADGIFRFISLLRFDSEFLPTVQAGGTGVPNDGWFIIREIVSSQTKNSVAKNTMESLNTALLQYLSIEHGGGSEDHKNADNLFHAESSLLSIGSQSMEETPSEWAGPVGSLVEVSRPTYLDGVASQKPHANSSKANDGILTCDILPCSLAAAATVEVGNGSQTNLFCDHLLLARSSASDTDWKIVSKIFSPRSWKE
jgi:hypothetical protein